MLYVLGLSILRRAVLKIQSLEHASSTKLCYEGKWRRYKNWCKSHFHDPFDFNVFQVLDYGANLKLSVDHKGETLRGNFTAISHYWKKFGYRGPSINADPETKSFLKGCLRMQGGPSKDIREACTAQGLNLVFNSMPLSILKNLEARAWMSFA